MNDARIVLMKGDITKIQVDAIVNAANIHRYLEVAVLMGQYTKQAVTLYLKSVEKLRTNKEVAKLDKQ